MAKIDTSTWKEFKVGDIFKCETTSGIANKNNLTEGDIPYITRSVENNGISRTCGNIEKIVKGNCITIGAEGFTAFYQKNDFVAGNKVYALRHPQMNEAIGLYLSSVLNVLSSKYSFADARILDRIKEEKILLPIREKEEIDFEYMEDYIKDIEFKVRNSLQILKNENPRTNPINIKKWGKFKLSDLFEKAERGTIKSLQTLKEGNTPIIAAGAYNKGIAGYYDMESKYENQITISCNGAGCGSAFYHNYPFNLNSDAIVLFEKEFMSKNSKIFIASIINSSFTKKYSYEEKCSSNKALSEDIYLPITPNGFPDYDYMDKFIESTTRGGIQRLQVLMKVL